MISIVFILLIIGIILLILLIQPIPSNKRNSIIPILRWNKTGITIAGTTGTAGNGSNQFDMPQDIVIDHAYNFYVADRLNHRIQKYSVGGLVGKTVAGNGTLGLSLNQLNVAPRVILDSNEDLYIADAFNSRIQFWKNGATSGKTVAGWAGMIYKE